MKTHFLTTSKNKHHLWKGLNAFLKSQLYSSELWQLPAFWPMVCTFITKQIHHVNLVRQIGRSAVLAHVANKRHLVGDIFLLIGVGAIFFHQIFDPRPWDHSWYFTNWFFFFEDLMWWMLLLFGSVATLFYWPSKSKSVYIVFTTLHSIGWLVIIHKSFFVTDFTSFHSLPVWDMWIVAASFGIGFILAVDHLAYVWEHKTKGNHKRFVMLAEHKETIDRKELDRMLANNVNEYHSLYKHY